MSDVTCHLTYVMCHIFFFTKSLGKGGVKKNTYLYPHFVDKGGGGGGGGG